MIDSLNAAQRVMAGRPVDGFRTVPYVVTDNDLHIMIPPAAGLNIVIMDALACTTGVSRVSLRLSDSAGSLLVNLTMSFEQTHHPYICHMILPVGLGLNVQRVAGNQDSCITVFGYIDTVEKEPTLYTVT